MIINQEAKLFGKINIIDFFLIAGLVGLIVFGIMRPRDGESGSIISIGGETREYVMTFFTEETFDFNTRNINVGDNVFDHVSGHYLGTVYAVEVGPAIVWNTDQYGNSVRSTKEGFSSIFICVHIVGTPDEHGFFVSGQRYGVGISRTIRAGANAIPMRVSAMREV
jgi:hypothetical protein